MEPHLTNYWELMTNQLAAGLFYELADLLDLAGELPFKSCSYRKVAQSLLDLDEPFEEVVAEGRYEKIPGAGKAIKEKLITLIETGTIPALEKWRQSEQASFYPWLEALHLQPRPLGMLARKLQAKNYKDLVNKLDGYDIKKLTGQSRTTAQMILKGGRLKEGDK
jgi:DNA polymerase (family X)